MSWEVAATITGGFATPAAILAAYWQWGRDNREEARGHARLVTAELGPTSVTGLPTVVVRNDGPGPISQVWLTVPGDQTPVHRVSKINGDDDSGPIAVTPVDPSTWFMSAVGCGGPTSASEPECDLRFVDLRGRAWRRHGLDKPERAVIPPDKPEWAVTPWQRRRYRAARLLGGGG